MPNNVRIGKGPETEGLLLGSLQTSGVLRADLYKYTPPIVAKGVKAVRKALVGR